MRTLCVAAVALAAAGCAAAPAPAPASTTNGTSSAGDEASSSRALPASRAVGEACIAEAERSAIDVSASTPARFEAALEAIDVPADASGLDPLLRSAAHVRALVLFDSIERDSSDPVEARLSAMLAMDVLGALASERPPCAGEACTRVGPVLSRHCPVELPDDDLTAACPTLALYASRCDGHAPREVQP